MVNGRQIRAARALLDMSQDELADQAGLTPQAIRKIEAEQVKPREGTVSDMVKVFDQRGVEFTSGQGVRFKENLIEIYQGPDRFDDFYEFLYLYLKENGGDVCISVSDESLLAKYRKDPDLHRRRMKPLFDSGKITFKIIAKNSNFSSDYAVYKESQRDYSAPTSFYAFGDCLALISFVHHTPPYVVLLKSSPLAQAYREAFEEEWQYSSTPKKEGNKK